MSSFIDFYRDFFEYDRWCNRRILEILQHHTPASDDPRRLFAHIVGAGRLWLTRMTGGDYSGLTPWPDLTLEQCASLAEELHAGWMSYLDDTTDATLDDTITYTNTKGEPFTTSIRDILTHVNNHSTYHRAQIARALKQEGIAPPVTDYIVYVREVR